MKKIITIILIAICMVCGLNNQATNLNAATTSTPRIEMVGSVISNNKVKVEVNLTRNTGLKDATFTVDYDKTNLEFYNYKIGGTLIDESGNEINNTALSSLSLSTTNSELSTPSERVARYNETINESETAMVDTGFQFFYTGTENDTSTGTLFILYFTVKEGTPEGKYEISLKVDEASKISAYKEVEEEINVRQFKFRVDEEGNPTTEELVELESWQIWLIVGGSVVVVIIGLYFLQLYIKKKAKEKIAAKLHNKN